MSSYIRDLHLFADGNEIAQGCHLFLQARDTLSLRPALHHLTVHDLSDSFAALLAGSRNLEIRSGHSILAFGETAEFLTRSVSGKRITDLVFSPGLSLWQASVSLSVAAGMRISETMRAILSAAVYPESASSSGTASGSSPSYPLATFAAQNAALSRPQSFFGRACDALTLLAETVGADIFLSSAGVSVSGRAPRAPSVRIPESGLLSEPLRTGTRILLSSDMLSWPLGAFAQYTWKGSTVTGRLVSRLLQADNRDGPWKSEWELEV